MEDLTGTEGREMEVTETEKTFEIGQLEVIEKGKTEDIIETDQRADMTGIIIMIGTEKEGEGMDFNRQKRE